MRAIRADADGNAASTLVAQSATSDAAMFEIENAAADHTFLEADSKVRLSFTTTAQPMLAPEPRRTRHGRRNQIQNRRSANGRFVLGYDHDIVERLPVEPHGHGSNGRLGKHYPLTLAARPATSASALWLPIALLTVEGSGVKTADFVSSFFSNTATSVTGGVSKLSAPTVLLARGSARRSERGSM